MQTCGGKYYLFQPHILFFRCSQEPPLFVFLLFLFLLFLFLLFLFLLVTLLLILLGLP